MQESVFPVAGTIAGSDSSGGAGIQADLKTFSALGVWGCTVITAITSQTSAGVTGVWPASAESVGAQIDTVQREFRVGAWKTGMLATREIVSTVAEKFVRGTPLIIDPVLVSSGGQPLLDAGALDTFIAELVSKATLITPNLAEACKLSGIREIRTEEDMISAGYAILDLGPEYVLIKGGHLESGAVTDILVGKSGVKQFPGVRYPYDPHGTGCTISAAITAYLAKGALLEEAVFSGKKFVEAAIQNAIHTRAGWQIHPDFEKKSTF